MLRAYTLGVLAKPLVCRSQNPVWAATPLGMVTLPAFPEHSRYVAYTGMCALPLTL